MERFNTKLLECYRPIQGETWNCWLKEGEREEAAGKLGNFAVLIDGRAIAGDVVFSTSNLQIPLKEDAHIKTENRLISIELEE